MDLPGVYVLHSLVSCCASGGSGDVVRQTVEVAHAGVAGEAGAPLFAGGWSHVLSRVELRSDQIHANADCYRVVAERLVAWLREIVFAG